MKKILVAAGLAAVTMLPALASAHSGVGFNISVGIPAPVIAAPVPVYYPPRPVYGPPAWGWRHHHHGGWDRDWDRGRDRGYRGHY